MNIYYFFSIILMYAMPYNIHNKKSRIKQTELERLNKELIKEKKYNCELLNKIGNNPVSWSQFDKQRVEQSCINIRQIEFKIRNEEIKLRRQQRLNQQQQIQFEIQVIYILFKLI